MQDYIGIYTAENNFSMKIFINNNQIFLQTNDGQPPYLLRANDLDSFNLLDFAGEEFIRDENGKIIKMKHFQNGHIGYLTKQ